MSYTKLTAEEAVKNALDSLKVYTLYRNSFPWNCLYKDAAGTIWGDCVNAFPKSLIWAHACGVHPFLNRKAQTYFYNGQNGSYPGIEKSGLGDWDITTIMNRCEAISFSDLIPGALMAVNGDHIALYCGEYEFAGEIYNSIEFNYFSESTQGAIPFWTGPSGRRYWYKEGGYMGGSFTRAGLLTEWIQYGERPETEKITYQVYIDVKKKWLPNITNAADYAGLPGFDICAVYASASKGNLKYAVHTWKGDRSEYYDSSKWLPEVKNREDYAGLLNQPADAFILFSDIPARYRVRLRKSGAWLPWVYTKDASYKDKNEGFAGVIGEPIDGLQIDVL